jgi:hypothetical protein
VLAVEDQYGGARDARSPRPTATAGQVWGTLHRSRAEAFAHAGMLAAGRPGSRLLGGASLDGDADTPTDLGASVETRTVTNTRAALPLLRELVAQCRLSHDGGGGRPGTRAGTAVPRLLKAGNSRHPRRSGLAIGDSGHAHAGDAVGPGLTECDSSPQSSFYSDEFVEVVSISQRHGVTGLPLPIAGRTGLA